MLTQVEETTPTTRKLRIDIPSSVIEEEISKAYNKLMSSAKIPGFRTGKVPRSILEKKFGKDVEAQVLEKIVPEFYTKAIREAQIFPITYPYIDGNLKLVKSPPDSNRFQPLSFTATVEIKPEIKALDYEGIVLKEKTVTIKEEETEEAVKALQTGKAVLKAIEGPLKEKDIAIINCDAFIDGGEVKELQSKDYPFIVGSPAMPKEFSEALINRKKGENFDIKINFDAGHPNKTIAGKEVLFKVSITELKEKVLPPLDDEFAKEFSCSSMEELREKINENIHKRNKNQTDSEYKKELLDHLISSHNFEVPKSLASRELEFQIDEAKQNALRRGEAVKPDEELKKEYEPKAYNNVKAMLILEAIAGKENIEVSEDDLKQAVNEIAAEHNLKAEEVTKLYMAKDGSLDGLKHRLHGDKTLDLILSRAVFKSDEVESKE